MLVVSWRISRCLEPRIAIICCVMSCITLISFLPLINFKYSWTDHLPTMYLLAAITAISEAFGKALCSPHWYLCIYPWSYCVHWAGFHNKDVGMERSSIPVVIGRFVFVLGLFQHWCSYLNVCDITLGKPITSFLPAQAG